MVLMLALQAQQPVQPGPAPWRYRLDVTTTSEIDQSVVGGPKLSGGLATHADITVSLRDTTGGQIVRIVVDSMTLDPSGGIVASLAQRPNAAADARGASVSAYVVQGKQPGMPQLSDSTNPALASVVQALGVLFPGVRRAAKPGDSWADTSHISNSSGPRRQTGEVVATWKVVAIDSVGMVLQGRSESRTRTEDGSGQVMTMTGGSTEEVVVPSIGPVRRASIETSNVMSISGPQLVQPIPGKNGGTLTLTPLP